LEAWDTPTMAKLAVLPLPLQEKPFTAREKASSASANKPRPKVQARTSQQSVYELLPVVEEPFYTSPNPRGSICLSI